jgi:Nitrate and nitrite sensing/Histidine kinase-, DNA gyrase B-, and HSP90-like ATPase
LRSRRRKISRVTAGAPIDETLAGRSDALTPGGPAAGPPPRHTSPGRALRKRQRATSSRALKNLRVRSRLLLLVAVPTIAAVALGGFRIVSSVQSEQLYQRVQQLAILGDDTTSLAQALEDERDHTVYYIALGADGGRASVLSASSTARAAMTSSQLGVQYAATDQAISEVRKLAQQIGSFYPRQTRQQATVVLAALDSLPRLRADAANTTVPVLTVVTRYAQIVEDLLALDNDIAQVAGDPALAQAVSALGLVSQMKEEASQQRALLAAALLKGAFGPHELTALQNAVSAQQTNLQAFDVTASPSQLQLWNADVAASFGNQTSADELRAISLAANVGGSGSLGGDPTTADDWYNTMTSTIEYQMGSVQRQLVASVTSRAATLRENSITDAVVATAAVLLILMLAVLFTVVIGQSMVRPLRTLRAGALRVAGVQLPEMVRRLSETGGEGLSLAVQPINVDSSDEIGEVARAFDRVHREALRLAANEAALRGNVNAMFVNLSRRSQSLVERQIRLIDDLEQGEQDPERLSNLFQMDHLATRMRRNSENLLVLAGHEVSRRWNQPVALVDVLRAAVSEIEQYERVSMNVQPGISVRGQAVNDAVHLVAELVENATSFSPAETPVTMSGHLLSSGGVLLDISDQGAGMGAEEMAHANWRLENPPVVDVAVSRRMGLFVVARLAARHGIRIRLRPAPTAGPSAGLTALVWLPDETVTYDTAGSPLTPRRFDRGRPGSPDSLDASSTLGTGLGRTGRSLAEDAINAARAPRFTSLHEDTNGDSAAAANPPASRPLWEDRSGPADLPSPAARTGRLPPLGDAGPAPVSGASQASESTRQPARSYARPVRTFADGRGPNGLVNSVPPTATVGEGNWLPVYESVESDWFRRSRRGTGRTAAVVAVGDTTSSSSWTSAADEGWRAAEALSKPASGGVTTSGLPKRIPGANLVPGRAGADGQAAPPPSPVRSATAARDRFASFQRGVREARATGRDDGEAGGEGNVVT